MTPLTRPWRPPLGHIRCLNCDGKGYVTTLGYNGMRYPLACAGCKGTGTQKVGSSG